MGQLRALTRFSLAAGMLSLGLANMAHASPITVNGGWYTFCVAGNGAPASVNSSLGGPCPLSSGIGLAGNTITFSSLFPTTLQVTDAFIAGESFRVVINGTSFFTPLVTPFGARDVSDPNAAFVNTNFSSGSWTLGPGNHNVDIFAVAPTSTGSGAYVQVITATATVPEPSTYTLLLSGLLAFGAARSRRRETAPSNA